MTRGELDEEALSLSLQQKPLSEIASELGLSAHEVRKAITRSERRSARRMTHKSDQVRAREYAKLQGFVALCQKIVTDGDAPDELRLKATTVGLQVCDRIMDITGIKKIQPMVVDMNLSMEQRYQPMLKDIEGLPTEEIASVRKEILKQLADRREAYDAAKARGEKAARLDGPGEDPAGNGTGTGQEKAG